MKPPHRFFIYVCAGLLLGQVLLASEPDSLELTGVGTRLGMSSYRHAGPFTTVEAFADFDLPFHWDFSPRWHLGMGLDAGVGWIGSQGVDSIVGEVGPDILLRHDGWPVWFDAGSHVAGLSRDVFGERDLGSLLEFISHGGVYWQPISHFCVGYEFEHISNGGFARRNPGLNLHILSLSYLF